MCRLSNSDVVLQTQQQRWDVFEERLITCFLSVAGSDGAGPFGAAGNTLVFGDFVHRTEFNQWKWCVQVQLWFVHVCSSLTEARPLRKIKNGSVKRPELMVRTHLFIHLLSELDWIIEWNDGQHFRREKHVARQQINKAIGLKASRKQNKLKWINEDVSVSSCSLSVCRSKNETRSLNLYRWRTSLCSSHVGKLLLIIYM